MLLKNHTNTPPNTITDGNWHHVVMTWDGTIVKHYLDGVATLPHMQDANGAWNSAFDVNIGRSNYVGNWHYFKGPIDDVRIYNRALSVSEVQQLYTGTPTPVGYNPQWLLITLVSLMGAGGYLIRRRTAQQ